MNALSNYPHVLERIRALWGNPELEGYIDSIMLADRDHRQGFLPEAWLELTRIIDVHRLLFGQPAESYQPFRFSSMLSHS